MSGLDKSIILDPLNLEINLQREAIQFGRLSQSNRGMDLSVGGSFLLTGLAGNKLKGAQKTRWKHE